MGFLSILLPVFCSPICQCQLFSTPPPHSFSSAKVAIAGPWTWEARTVGWLEVERLQPSADGDLWPHYGPPPWGRSTEEVWLPWREEAQKHPASAATSDQVPARPTVVLNTVIVLNVLKSQYKKSLKNMDINLYHSKHQSKQCPIKLPWIVKSEL